MLGLGSPERAAGCAGQHRQHGDVVRMRGAKATFQSYDLLALRGLYGDDGLRTCMNCPTSALIGVPVVHEVVGTSAGTTRSSTFRRRAHDRSGRRPVAAVATTRSVGQRHRQRLCRHRERLS
jgi:hypothetical protein